MFTILMIKSKDKVKKFLEKHPETDTFEISVSLRLPFIEVSDILLTLEDEGLVQVIKN